MRGDSVLNSKELKKTAEEAADFFRADTRLLIFVYQNGRPVADYPVEVRGRHYQTDHDGLTSVKLPSGGSAIHFPRLRESRQVELAEGEEMEMTLVLTTSKDESLADLQIQGAVSSPEIQVPLKEVLGTPVEVRVQSDSGQALAGAILRVPGYEGVLGSDSRGRIQLHLPPGDHSLVVSEEKHALKTEKISVVGDLPREIVLRLNPSSSELEEFVVLAPQNRGSVAALVEIRRSSSAVAEVLGSEQMSRQGDGDAASSLRRVTGLTLVGGKYVYVRGLGERYSAVQMNGLGLPSPEPARRVVPLDLFPTSVLESVVVQKSFTPEMPAEFGGGLIQLKTRSLPEEFFFRGQLSVNVEESGDRMTYQGGRTDFYGVDDGTRALPGGIREALGSGKKLYEFSGPELQQLGLSLPNIYAVRKTQDQALPGLSLGTGNRWRFEGFSVGAAASLLNSSSMDTTERLTRKFNVGAGGTLVSAEEARTQVSEMERKLGSSLDLGMQIGENNQLIFSGLFVRNTSDEVQVKDFSQAGDSYDSRRRTSLEWVQRDLTLRQLQGKHRFNRERKDRPVEFEWKAGLADAYRDEPDSREYVYLERNGLFEFNTDTTGNRRVYSTLNDQSREVSLSVLVPQEWGEQNFRFRVGALAQDKDRRSNTYRLHFKNRYPLSSKPDLSQEPEVLFAPGNICPDCFELTNLTESADSYQGRQNVQALFMNTEWSPHSDWELSAGVRDESSRQEVSTFFYFEPQTPTSRAGLRARDVLPAYSATWKPSDRLRARLAYGETVARPDFRELSTVPFIDDESGYEAVGNDRLQGTVIRNLDHRWEYYFSSDEYASVGVFLKRFERPIEEVFEPGPNLRKTYENALAAENRGLELETRWGLRHFSRELRRWTILTNVSLIDSQIQLDAASSGVQTSTDRPLQGQSPYVLNFQIQYDRPAQKRSATLLYNRIGQRITEVGTGGRPDVYEQAFDQVDLVFSQGLMKSFNLQIRARNLLDPEVLATQGSEVVRSYRRGRSFSVGLNAVF